MKSTNPLVSVILPTYNRAELIKETLDSIISQSYLNIELIVISDGSSDNTDEVLEMYRKKDDRIIYKPLSQNTGLPAKVRNTGLRLAKGEYIAFCDDDDIWERDKLELQIAALRSRKGGISFTNRSFFTASKVLDKSRFSYFIPTLCNWLIESGFKSTLLFTNHIINSSVVVHKDVIADIGYLNEDRSLRATEDYEYWLRIVRKYKACFIPKKLIRYRIHPDQISKNKIPALQRSYKVISNAKGYPSLMVLAARRFLRFRIDIS